MVGSIVQTNVSDIIVFLLSRIFEHRRLEYRHNNSAIDPWTRLASMNCLGLNAALLLTMHGKIRNRPRAQRHLKSHPSHAVICSEEMGMFFLGLDVGLCPVSVSAIPRRPVPKALVRTAPQRPCRTRPPIPSSPQRQKQSHH